MQTAKAHVVLITPKMATGMLNRTAHNRPLRLSHVNSLAKVMEAREWKLNGQTIKLNYQGQLIDGQHRLLACIQAATPFSTWVIEGVDEAVMTTIDIGAKRSPGDMLSLRGYANANALAAAARWMWRYDTEQMAGYVVNPTMETIVYYTEQYPELSTSIPYGIMLRPYMPKGLATMLHCLFSYHDKIAADNMFRTLKEGENLSRSDTLWKLRDRLIKNSQAKAKLPAHEIAALMIKAFNAYRAGKKIGMLRWGSVGVSNEPFPKVEN